MNYVLGPNDFQVGKTYAYRDGEYIITKRTRCYVTLKFTKIPNNPGYSPLAVSGREFKVQVANDIKGVEYICIDERFRADHPAEVSA